MSVIIHGINVPVNCASCLFGHRMDNFTSFCELKQTMPRVKDTEPRPDYCPLEEINE